MNQKAAKRQAAKRKTAAQKASAQRAAAIRRGEEVYGSGFARFWLKKRKQNLYLLLSFLLVGMFAGCLFVGIAIGKKLNMINFDLSGGYDYSNVHESYSADEEEDPDFAPVNDITDAASLKDWLRKWASNGGEKMYNKNIVNCLLCGIDSDSGNMVGGRADAMILLSLDKRTNKITLTSLMRDSYTYMNINGDEIYYKLNSAYNWGGPATLVEAIENNYKIKIDNYVCVDFNTFPKVINALGGVTLEVQRYEANYINRTTRHTISYGPAVTLDGWEALVFSRIRYSDIDGDISRTRRHRQVIMALINKARDASAGQINNMLNQLLPFVRTNYSRTQILSMSAQAMVGGWVDYDITQLTMPQTDTEDHDNETVTGKSTHIQTKYGSAPEFFWIVDYQLDARRLQMEIYGQTNIELHDDRVSPFDFISRITYATTQRYETGTEPETGTENGETTEDSNGRGHERVSLFDWFNR
ncbi:MAG: LCP family protein [Oscillospiraceae bacterium]|nr:LCP family protein [Oscillospiraceae bacterium]